MAPEALNAGKAGHYGPLMYDPKKSDVWSMAWILCDLRSLRLLDMMPHGPRKNAIAAMRAALEMNSVEAGDGIRIGIKERPVRVRVAMNMTGMAALPPSLFV